MLDPLLVFISNYGHNTTVVLDLGEKLGVALIEALPTRRDSLALPDAWKKSK